MNDHSSFRTDALIAEDIDAYLDTHQHKSSVDHRLSASQPDDAGDGGARPAAAVALRRGRREEHAMIGRIVWFTALLTTAVLTTMVQLDREAARKPALAAVVPEPFRAFAQTHIAAAAAESGDAARATAEARRLIRRRPVPAEHLSLLAVAQTKAGMENAATYSIQIAGQRGWREPLAQEAVLRLALAAGDRPEAARRYAALLLRDGTPDALLEELGSEVFAGAGSPGRKALTDVIVGAERWPDLFMRRGGTVMPPDAFVEVVAASTARGTRFDCALLERTAKALSRRDENAGRSLAGIAEACRPA